MPLISSPRLRPEDVTHWKSLRVRDLSWSKTQQYRNRVESAEMDLIRFARKDGVYTGISWGKDSTALADMVCRLTPSTPLVCIRGEPIHNPDCDAVRNAFLSIYPEANYHEITVRCPVDSEGVVHATGTIERGFKQAKNMFGPRHVSGVRAEESGQRRMRQRRFGVATEYTCAPLIQWSANDVFAYLESRGLPIHPVYAMTYGGALDRNKNRVSWLTLKHGRGMGRLEWERSYYPDLAE